jgi:hypothetical protein
MASIENVSSKIVHINKDTATIFVKYTTPKLPNGLRYAIDLPIAEDNTVPTGTSLSELIIHHTPLEQLTQAEYDYAWYTERISKAPLVDYSDIPVEPEAPATTSTVQGTQTL